MANAVKRIQLPISEKDLAALSAGDAVLLSGTLLTARDAAHKRLCALLKDGQPLPFSLQGETIYYTGPCPAPEGKIIGSCGPTTSGRMDSYTPLLLEHGLRGMVGKGERSAAVTDAMKKHGAVYFAAVGGAGALYASCVTACETVCFPELLSEAVRRLTVKDMPVIVAIDAKGKKAE